MINLNRKILAAKIACVFVVGLGITSTLKTPEAEAGIPVIDVAGLVQNVLSALEAVSQTLQMIEQYKTQLQQFENQVTNTLTLDTWLWDDAQQTINGLLGAMDSVRSFKNKFGSIDQYLKKFKDVDYYKQLPCLDVGGCTKEQMQVLASNVRKQDKLSSEVRKEANDALVKSIDKQQDALENDADKLRSLQNNAQSSTGQLEAIQHASQLASNQANQLLQIRALMIAQQSALSAEKQSDEDRTAREQAAGEKLRESRYERSTGKSTEI